MLKIKESNSIGIIAGVERNVRVTAIHSRIDQ
jgi:hypothetical protein